MPVSRHHYLSPVRVAVHAAVFGYAALRRARVRRSTPEFRVRRAALGYADPPPRSGTPTRHGARVRPSAPLGSGTPVRRAGLGYAGTPRWARVRRCAALGSGTPVRRAGLGYAGTPRWARVRRYVPPCSGVGVCCRPAQGLETGNGVWE
ncbi:hypothetical protein [Kribbella sp. NPDC004536]|uniref:hypothetical protein n=1 Tax=Kribbella sp. NPDC004536 TaxID=3364106 RepID=UPI0036AAFD85